MSPARAASAPAIIGIMLIRLTPRQGGRLKVGLCEVGLREVSPCEIGPREVSPIINPSTGAARR